MSDHVRNEIAREKIRQMVREGKDPRSMFNHDNDIHDFEYNNSTEAVQDVIAQEKLRMMVNRGENPSSSWSQHNDRDIRNYLERSDNRNRQSSSSYSSYSSNTSSNNFVVSPLRMLFFALLICINLNSCTKISNSNRDSIGHICIVFFTICTIPICFSK